jgi:predicted SprT family Zn-dependent metalloprotease
VTPRHPVDSRRLDGLRSSVSDWAKIWGVPELGRDVTVRISSRFRRSLGGYRAARAEVTLAEWLLDGPVDLLREVLCHEAAHAAVRHTHGDGVRPHGREWRDFMALAGMRARVRIPASELPLPQQAALAKARVWEHRCPVCQATRLAKTRVTRWRCRPCREAGRPGELLIERVPNPVAVDG